MSFCKRIRRKKPLLSAHTEHTKMTRVLSTVDVTFLGVGNTIGVGVYVLAGIVCHFQAGPAVILSFLIAAVSSLLSGVCYAEFGSRVPAAGSAYTFGSVYIGELAAFFLGWCLVLEYIFGGAGVTRALSRYVDHIFEIKLMETFREWAPIDLTTFSSYPDLLAIGVVLVPTVIVAMGVRSTSLFHKLLSSLNLAVIVFFVVCASFKADLYNWEIPKQEIPKNYAVTGGEGGFFPFGFTGVIQGAIISVFGFVGSDMICTTGEEVKNPWRAIPVSILISLLCIYVINFSSVIVVSLMLPYFLQETYAIPSMFQSAGWNVAMWIINAGALTGMTASLLGCIFAAARIIYRMASDGLLFRCMGDVDMRTHTPVRATIICGVWAGLLAVFFDLRVLVTVMSLVTLLVSALVAVCVMMTRYKAQEMDSEEDQAQVSCLNGNSGSLPTTSGFKPRDYALQVFNLNRLNRSSQLSSAVSSWAVISFFVVTIAFCCTVIFAWENLTSRDLWAIVLVSILGGMLVLLLLSLGAQPQSQQQAKFMVPLFPVIPEACILLNIYLVFNIHWHYWIHFGLWMLLGLIVYFLYGTSMGSEENQQITKQAVDPKVEINEGFDEHEERLSPGNKCIPTITVVAATPQHSGNSTPEVRMKAVPVTFHEEENIPPSMKNANLDSVNVERVGVPAKVGELKGEQVPEVGLVVSYAAVIEEVPPPKHEEVKSETAHWRTNEKIEEDKYIMESRQEENVETKLQERKGEEKYENLERERENISECDATVTGDMRENIVGDKENKCIPSIEEDKNDKEMKVSIDIITESKEEHTAERNTEIEPKVEASTINDEPADIHEKPDSQEANTEEEEKRTSKEKDAEQLQEGENVREKASPVLKSQGEEGEELLVEKPPVNVTVSAEQNEKVPEIKIESPSVSTTLPHTEVEESGNAILQKKESHHGNTALPYDELESARMANKKFRENRNRFLCQNVTASEDPVPPNNVKTKSEASSVATLMKFFESLSKTENEDDINNETTATKINQSVKCESHEGLEKDSKPESESEIVDSPSMRPRPKLTRGLSFEELPPSTPDSPHAQKIGSKFTLIPVFEGAGIETVSPKIEDPVSFRHEKTPESGNTNVPEKEQMNERGLSAASEKKENEEMNQIKQDSSITEGETKTIIENFPTYEAEIKENPENLSKDNENINRQESQPSVANGDDNQHSNEKTYTTEDESCRINLNNCSRTMTESLKNNMNSVIRETDQVSANNKLCLDENKPDLQETTQQSSYNNIKNKEDLEDDADENSKNTGRRHRTSTTSSISRKISMVMKELELAIDFNDIEEGESSVSSSQSSSHSPHNDSDNHTRVHYDNDSKEDYSKESENFKNKTSESKLPSDNSSTGMDGVVEELKNKFTSAKSEEVTTESELKTLEPFCNGNNSTSISSTPQTPYTPKMSKCPLSSTSSTQDSCSSKMSDVLEELKSAMSSVQNTHNSDEGFAPSWISALPSPNITGTTRAFKKPLSKERVTNSDDVKSDENSIKERDVNQVTSSINPDANNNNNNNETTNNGIIRSDSSEHEISVQLHTDAQDTTTVQDSSKDYHKNHVSTDDKTSEIQKNNTFEMTPEKDKETIHVDHTVRELPPPISEGKGNNIPINATT